MKKKALVVIALYFSLMFIHLINFNETTEESIEDIQVVFQDGNFEQNIDVLNILSKTQGTQPINTVMQPLDLVTPSYTNLSLSEGEPIIEGTEITLTSLTTSSGYGVSSGEVDFKDLKLLAIDNDTTTTSIYSNKFAFRINLPQTTIIYGFLTDVTPTVREDINFYIRDTLTGSDIRNGVVTGYIANSAHVSNQLLHIPFEYCGGGTPLTLTANTDYYFLLEPTVSISDTFFELRESSDVPDDMKIYEWWGANYAEIITDANFYLITDVKTISEDNSVDFDGYASALWTTVDQGRHSFIAWYKGSAFNAESFGSAMRTIIPSTELLLVSIDPIVTEYNDPTILQSTVLIEAGTPAEGKTVTFLASLDGQSWITIGSAVTNLFGQALLEHQFVLEPDNYILRAKVNEYSLADTTLEIQVEGISWYNVDFLGQYRNNLGAPTYTKLSAIIQVRDNDDEPVPSMDFDLWYKFDGIYERIPHYFTTNGTGFGVLDQGIEDLLAGHYVDTHYFTPADYEYGYIGNSAYGDSIVEKGILEIDLLDYSANWNDDVLLIARITSLEEGWNGITVRFSYFDNSQWVQIGEVNSNATGYAQFNWYQMPLIIGNYLLKAETLESSQFISVEKTVNFDVGRRNLVISILYEGELIGSGEEIDLEYTSTINLVFYVEFEDGTPASDILVEINGRQFGDTYYGNIGYTTTNASGYALFNDYHNLTLVGKQYQCVAEIAQTSRYEGYELHFKINLIKCTPVIYFENQQGEKGTYTELIAMVKNLEGSPLSYVHVRFIINGIVYEGISDCYGFIRVYIAPELSTGQYVVNCITIEDEKYNSAQTSAYFYLSKGLPYFILLDAAAIQDGFLTIRAQAFDSLGRPIANLTVRITFYGWSELLTTDANGLIEYTFSAIGFDIGSYLSVLTFEGNDDWYDVTTTGEVLIYEQESNLELLTTEITITYGEEIYIQAKLESLQGLPLDNRIVKFIILLDDGTIIELGQNITNVYGLVSFRTTIIHVPGSFEIGVSYTGAVDFGPSEQFTSFVIQKAQVVIIGSDFDAIVNSTATFRITLYDMFGAPIQQAKIYLFIWYGNNWVLLGIFTTNQLGYVDISIVIPFSLGVHTLKAEFQGDDFYNSGFLGLEMTVIEAPPKILPEIILSSDDLIVADHQEVIIDITVTNAVSGAAVMIYVFINNIYNDTVTIINGYGYFSWQPTKIGQHNLTFLSVEDTVYLISSLEITIQVEQNIPPELIGYYFDDYICEGESFVIEANFHDVSGIKSVWFIANGTQYELVKVESIYTTTIYMLRQGVYNNSLVAEDMQGYIAIYDLDPLTVFERKTQVLKYHFGNVVLEFGQELKFEALIYAENPLSQVYFLINSTEYQMSLSYQIDAHRSVWLIGIDSLNIGNFEIKIKIVEESGSVYIRTISERLLVIPIAPQLLDYYWQIESGKSDDFISGNITIDSYYPLDLIEVWIDGQKLTVTMITEGVYNFYGYVSHTKSHVLTIKVTDIMGRVLTDEIELGGISGSSVLTISLVVSVLVIVALIAGALYLSLQRKNRTQTNISSSELELPDISDELLETFEDEPQLPDESVNQTKKSKSQNKRKKAVVLPIASVADDLAEDFLNETLEPVEIESTPQLEEVKEYIAKVKNDGLLPDENGEMKKTIDDLSSLTPEIDIRVLSKEEQMKILAAEEESESLKSTVISLKEIAEEIDQTFRQKGGC
ncbi:MAG: hypothetical protein KAX09_10155 [Candidatus Heimdallarchaeota archaeon]|nr:hypothetical protein [Candidatus Heimdallarchaeota archaeon]MCK4291333.1 hypothetical protein [Candidatus Heimdallarchaeota archaeon]